MKKTKNTNDKIIIKNAAVCTKIADSMAGVAMRIMMIITCYKGSR